MTLRNKGLAVLSAGAVLALGLSACGGSSSNGGGGSGTPQKGGTLKILGDNDVDHIDPLSAYFVLSTNVARTFARTLVTYPASKSEKKSITIVPDVAKEVPTQANGGISKDGLTYTFHLRDGVMWNTKPARAVTAGDFVRTFKRMCNPAQPVGNIAYYETTVKGMTSYCDAETKAFTPKNKGGQGKKGTAANIAKFQNSHDISGLKAKDDKTLVIHLGQRASDFLNIMAMTFTAASPKEYDSLVPDSAKFRTHTISDGPYQISKYVAKKEIDLSRNPAWKASSDPLRPAYVDNIHITLGQSNAEAVQQQMQAGTADLGWDLPFPPQDIPKMKSNKDPNFGIYPGHISNPFIVFNMASKKSPLHDLKVRQAIEYTVNKVAINKIYGGPSLNEPISTAIPPGNVGYKPYNLYPSKNNEGNPAKCKQLIAQTPYKKGLTLKFWYRNNGNHIALAQSIGQDLKNCGINVKLIPVPNGVYYGSQYLGDPKHAKQDQWDLAEPGWIPDWYGNNGRSVLQPLFSKQSFPPAGSNYGLYSNPKVDGLIKKALADTSTSAAANDWHQADVQIMKDAAFVPLQNQNTPLYHSSRVHNAIYLPTSQQFDYSSLWLGKK